MIQTIGDYEHYTPQRMPDGIPNNVAFARCGDGVDWYARIKSLTIGPTYVQVKAGHVIALTDDPSKLWPVGCTVLLTDEQVDREWTYDGTSFSPPVLAQAQALPAIAASLPADVKEIIIGLAETVSSMQQRAAADAADHAARIQSLEAEIQGLKGVVR